MSKRLSILICSIVSRKEQLRCLINSLKSQTTKEVEILVETDDGEITVGMKRNVLLKRAIGDYVAFVDDDDAVSDDYVSKILSALVTSPDCCSLEGEITHMIQIKRRNHKQRKRCVRRVQKFVHSIRYKEWFEKDGIYYRCPNHLNTVKREITLRVMFPDMKRGEDKDYSLRLRPLLRTEKYIDGIIYFYRAS